MHPSSAFFHIHAVIKVCVFSDHQRRERRVTISALPPLPVYPSPLIKPTQDGRGKSLTTVRRLLSLSFPVSLQEQQSIHQCVGLWTSCRSACYISKRLMYGVVNVKSHKHLIFKLKQWLFFTNMFIPPDVFLRSFSSDLSSLVVHNWGSGTWIFQKIAPSSKIG